MIRLIPFLSFIILITSCTSVGSELSQNEIELAKNIDFETKVFQYVKETTDKQIYQLNDDIEKKKVNGIYIEVNEKETIKILTTLRDKINPLGYFVFVSEKNYGYEQDRIGVIKSKDQYDIIRIEHTDGINYDINSQDVINKLKEWEKKYPFHIIGADYDWVEIEFKELPNDINLFTNEVYEFCPDIIDQGSGSVEELSKEIKQTNTLLLWWD